MSSALKMLTNAACQDEPTWQRAIMLAEATSHRRAISICGRVSHSVAGLLRCTPQCAGSNGRDCERRRWRPRVRSLAREDAYLLTSRTRLCPLLGGHSWLPLGGAEPLIEGGGTNAWIRSGNERFIVQQGTKVACIAIRQDLA